MFLKAGERRDGWQWSETEGDRWKDEAGCESPMSWTEGNPEAMQNGLSGKKSEKHEKSVGVKEEWSK